MIATHLIIIIVFTGLIAGVVHVLTGPDHIAAVAPLTASKPDGSWKIGLWWGIGHTGSVWLLALLIFFLRDMIPLEGMSFWSERFVGAVLIVLGLFSFKRAFRSKVHYHIHEHDGSRHAHFHVHDCKTSHDHPRAHRHSHASLGIGMLHGLAGSSHFLAILPALALPSDYGAVLYIGGFGIGTIFSMAGFSWLVGLFVNNFSKAYRWIQCTFAAFALGVGLFWMIAN